MDPVQRQAVKFFKMGDMKYIRLKGWYKYGERIEIHTVMCELKWIKIHMAMGELKFIWGRNDSIQKYFIKLILLKFNTICKKVWIISMMLLQMKISMMFFESNLLKSHHLEWQQKLNENRSFSPATRKRNGVRWFDDSYINRWFSMMIWWFLFWFIMMHNNDA